MTRKDYIAIAAVLLGVRNSYKTEQAARAASKATGNAIAVTVANGKANAKLKACDDHARRMADMLGQDNPRFNRVRFLVAAGVES